MSLLDEAKAATPQRGPTCGAGRFMASLSPEMRAEVQECLDDPDVSLTALCVALTGRGYDPPKNAVWGHHRRGGCKCDG